MDSVGRGIHVASSIRAQSPVTAVDSKGKYTWAVILVTILVISKIIMGGTLVKAAWLVFCVLVWSFIGIAALMVLFAAAF